MDRFERQNYSIFQRAGAGIQPYMAQVYGWMMVGLLLTAFVAWYAINNSNIIMYLATHSWVLIGFIVAEFSLVIGLSSLLPKLNRALATGMFMLYSALTGLTISLVLVAYAGATVASTFFITAATFGVLSFYGSVTKRSLSGIGSFLFMIIIGLVITSLVNIWLQSSGLTLVITYVGVLIFAGLTAYDTQKLKDMGSHIDIHDPEDMRKYAILGALTLYLDFLNLFLIMLRIIGDRR
ncbi:Inner membrane protein YbhL [Arsenophonus endosymbiont of Aleurodicus dispersus]|uniref:Bax inhibitor-1/YccA family protein n=1 Tax=Arsenophonus endosymbiont of Aleurodicus dispersus TaxID=235559 RepID=UPI000EB47C8D|nr:Bax inhibitor-1/YccA family protein [Arsenophonus endosymbiont of Aleurodicus dispersus]VAY02449.1 Inner membrane protein YbhL [Arsenophonus endosymbiont of Aleurodicus dispersus]